MNIWKIVFILMVMSAVSVAYAKDAPPVPPFLYDGRPVDAKAIAMGEAFTAECDNASAFYWNPAGLCQLSNSFFGLSYMIKRNTSVDSDVFKSFEPIHGKNIMYFALSTPKMSLSYRPVTDYKHNYMGKNIEAKLNSYTLSIPTNQSQNMLFGVNFSYLYSVMGITDAAIPSAEVSTGQGISIGWGCLYRLTNITKLGFSCENGPGYIWWDDYKRQILKSRIRVGTSNKPLKWFTWTTEYEKLNSIDKEVYHTGLQQAILERIYMRQGYSAEKIFKKPENKTFSTGLGYEHNGKQFDFAVKNYKINDNDDMKVWEYLASANIAW